MQVVRSLLTCVCTLFMVSFLGDVTAGSDDFRPVSDFFNPDTPADFQPALKVRSESEADLLRSEELFVQARVSEHGEDTAKALRLYERSWRLHPSESVLRCIVNSACELNRYSEAARYFQKMQTPESLGIFPLRTMAVHCMIEEDFKQSVAAYRAALRAIQGTSNYTVRVFLRSELARGEYIIGDYEEARKSFEYVRRALKDPKKYDLDESLISEIQKNELMSMYLLLDTYLLLERTDDAETLLNEIRAREVSDLAKQDGPDDMDSEANINSKSNPNKKQKREARWDCLAAKIACQRSDFATARTLLERSIQPETLPESAEIYELYRDILLHLEMSDALIPALEAWYARSPGNAVLGMFLADSYFAQARTLFETPDSDPETVRLAWQKAEKAYQDLTAATPVLEAYIGLLRIAIAQQDSEKFIHLLYQITAQLESSEMLDALCLLAITEDGEDTEDKKDAEDGKNIETLKDTSLAEFGTKTAQYAREKYAADSSDTAWQFFHVIAWLARTFEEESLAEPYEQATRRVLQSLPKSEHGEGPAQFYLAECQRLFTAKDREVEAEACIREGRRFFTNDDQRSMYHYLLAHLALAQRNFEVAHTEIAEALKIQPKNIAFQSFQATLWHQAGDSDRAVAAYRKILAKNENEYDSDFNRREVADIREALSSIVSFQKNFAESEELLELVLDEYPDDVGAKNDLAYLWSVQKKNLARALVYAEEAVADKPDNYAYQDTLGWIHFQLGNYEKARECLEPLTEKEDDPVLYSHLADIYLALGNKEKAVELLEKSVLQFQVFQQEKRLFDPEDKLHAEAQLNSLKAS